MHVAKSRFHAKSGSGRSGLVPPGLGWTTVAVPIVRCDEAPMSKYMHPAELCPVKHSGASRSPSSASGAMGSDKRCHWPHVLVARQILCSVSSVTLSPVITRSSPSCAICSKNPPIRAIRSRISAVNIPDLARRAIVFSSGPEGSARSRNRPPLDRYSSTPNLISLIVVILFAGLGSVANVGWN